MDEELAKMIRESCGTENPTVEQVEAMLERLAALGWVGGLRVVSRSNDDGERFWEVEVAS